VVTQSGGASQSDYGFTGEFTSGDSTQLIYLRARYYNPYLNQFIQPDTIVPDPRTPADWNKYTYVRNNPINYTDPTGYIAEKESTDADKIVKELRMYNVFVAVDWGTYNYWYNPKKPGLKPEIRCGWNDGEWSLWELQQLRKGPADLARAMGGLNKFIFNLGYVNVYKTKLDKERKIADSPSHTIRVNNTMNDMFNLWSAVHELGHNWDSNFNGQLSDGLVAFTGGVTNPNNNLYCTSPNDTKQRLPGCNDAGYYYGGTPAAGAGKAFNKLEDFAESVTAYVYPNEAQSKVQGYLNDPDYGFLYYDDFRTQPRWVYIHALIQTTSDIQKNRNH
jgi:RHS repeat-associated protein